VQLKILALDEKSPDTAKIYRWKKIFDVQIENEALMPVLVGVGDYVATSAKTVRNTTSVILGVYFFTALI
jgi:hypothetical protein